MNTTFQRAIEEGFFARSGSRGRPTNSPGGISHIELGSRVGVCWSLASFAQGRAEMKKPERAKPDAPAVRKSAVRANYGIRKVPAECQSVPLKEISHPACASL